MKFNQINERIVNVQNAINLSLENASSFITRVNDANIEYLTGTIISLLVINDAVYALIQKNVSYNQAVDGSQADDGGNSYFNAIGGVELEKHTVPELFIRTNLTAINNNLDRYKGKKCSVVLKKGVAVYAEIDEGDDNLTVFPNKLLKNIRASDPNFDLFSTKSRDKLKEAGYTDEEINDLKKFIFKEDLYDKTIAFKDDALWFNDTSKPKDNQVLLDPLEIIPGLNKLNMKSKDCHFPSTIFSGK